MLLKKDPGLRDLDGNWNAASLPANRKPEFCGLRASPNFIFCAAVFYTYAHENANAATAVTYRHLWCLFNMRLGIAVCARSPHVSAMGLSSTGHGMMSLFGKRTTS